MTSFLRSLSPEQQVSLLFVVLFGLLTLASGVAVLLCLPPSALTLVWTRWAAKGPPEQQLLALLGGTTLRMGFVLLGGLLLAVTSVYFQQANFWIWLLLAYLFTLSLEMLLLLQRRPANPPLV